MYNIPSQEETSLSDVHHDAVRSSLEALAKNKERKNNTFSDE